MPTDTNVNGLVINKLTKAQYEAIQNPSETELYLVPDTSVDSTTVSSIVTLTEAQYEALSTKDSSTLYIITSS